jgi:hypothetical protein
VPTFLHLQCLSANQPASQAAAAAVSAGDVSDDDEDDTTSKNSMERTDNLLFET